MVVDLAAARRLRQLIAEVTAVLGPPLRRSLQHSSFNPVLRSTMWDCGCLVGYIESVFARPDDPPRWDTCGEHRRFGRVDRFAGWS